MRPTMTTTQAHDAGWSVRHDYDGWVLRDATSSVLDTSGLEGGVWPTRRAALDALASRVVDVHPSSVSWVED